MSVESSPIITTEHHQLTGRSRFTKEDQQLLTHIDNYKAAFEKFTPKQIQERKHDIQREIKSHHLSEKEAQPQLLALAGRAIEIATDMKLRDSQYVTAFAMISGMPVEFPENQEENKHKINGRLVEKKSGEGKTLAVGAATIASAMITQISNEAVHVMPPNDYLSKRDLQELGKAYEACGLKAGIILYGGKEQYIFDSTQTSKDQDYPNLIPVENTPLNDISRARRRVYSESDIIYGTIQSFIVDQLQDNQQLDPSLKRQVRLNSDGTYRTHVKAVALLDEADQTLIDQAEIPVRLADVFPVNAKREALLLKANQYALQLKPPMYNAKNKLVEGDYQVYGTKDSNPTISITQQGYRHLKELIQPPEAKDPTKDPLDEYLFTTHHEVYDAIYNAVLANAQTFRQGETTPAYIRFQEGRDFIVQNNEVVLLDTYTNRTLKDTKISLGIHQALEARIKGTQGRENEVEISGDQMTVDETTIQAYIRSYRWRSGATGTALYGKKTLERIYNLDVMQIPSDFKSQQEILPSILTQTATKADRIIADKIRTARAEGTHQPILILTANIVHAEALAKLLQEDGIQPTVLTALSTPEEEARAIAQAGTMNKITIATTIAGRGTDIKLNDDVQSLNIILADVLPTRREQQQAKDRMGRQGQKGTFQIISSFQSDTFRQVGKDPKLRGLFSNRYGETRADSLRHRPTFHTRMYGNTSSPLPYDQDQPNPEAFVGNDNMLAIIQQEAEMRKMDELELVVHTDHVLEENRRHFQRSRDRFRDPESSEKWIRQATDTLLPRIIRSRIETAAKKLQKVAGDQEADRQRDKEILDEALTLHIPVPIAPDVQSLISDQLQEATAELQELAPKIQADRVQQENSINNALTLLIPQPSGQMILQSVTTVAEVNAYLQAKNMPHNNILDMQPSDRDEAILTYLKFGKDIKRPFATVEEINTFLRTNKELNTDLTLMSTQEQIDAVTRYLQLCLKATYLFANQRELITQVAQNVYPYIWQEHVATTEDIFAGVFLHTKPLEEYARATAFDLQSRLDFMSERMLVHAIELTHWHTKLEDLLDQE